MGTHSLERAPREASSRISVTREHYSRFPYPLTAAVHLPEWLPPVLRRWLVRPKGRRYARALEALVAPERRAGARLLDAGCGTGEITCTIAERSRWGSIVACDLTERSLEAAAELARRRGLRDAIEFRRADLSDPEALADAAPFDAIVSLGVLHHLPDPTAGLRNLAGWLEPDGVMLVYLYGTLGRVGLTRRQEFLSLLAPGEDALDEKLAIMRACGFLRRPRRGLRGGLLSLLGVPRWAEVESRAIDDMANPLEVSYTANEIVGMLDAAGLELVRWFRGIPDDAREVLPPEIAERVDRLPPDRRLRALELLTGPGSYVFAARRRSGVPLQGY